MVNTNESLEVEVSSTEEMENSCRHLMYKTVGGYSQPDSGFKVCIQPSLPPSPGWKDLTDCVTV